MRVSDAQRYRTFSQDIQQRLVNMTRIQRELATGTSLFAPSESVTRAESALRAEDELALERQFMRNIENGKIVMNAADAKLGSVVDLITQIETLALSANDSHQNEEDRRNTALQIDQKIEELVRLTNARSGDRYLFGGHGTTNAPFTVERNESGRISGASANPDTIAGIIYRRIGANEDVQINVSGAALFQPVGSKNTDQDVFYVVTALRDTIGNNNMPPEGFEETRANEYLRERLAAIRERIAEQQVYLGSVGQRLETSLARLKEHEVLLTDRLEEAQGVDLTELVSRSAVEEGAYEALATLGGRLLQRSLIDYLR
ncbi:hypothetical protein KKH27_04930 [bacterium]|nr:hypothetical protein [bacterium]